MQVIMPRLARIIGVSVVLWTAAGPAVGQAPAAPTAVQATSQELSARALLAGARSWGYQLQHADPDVVARSPYDVVVVDSTESGDEDSRFKREAVRKMQARPDGRRRIVLAYLSIGEAESYRFYWSDDWVETLTIAAEGEFGDGKPAKSGGKGLPAKSRKLHIPRLSAPNWLGRENAQWSGNYLVRYWEKGWQDIIFGSPQAYLERIVAAGFDGVYLDRVDAFYGVTDERAEGKSDMIRFVTDLARHARALKPGFLIVPQNGEELLQEPAYVAVIDGIAKEDLLYGNPSEGQPNVTAVVRNSREWLANATRRGLPVLVVEYVLEKTLADRLGAEITSLGFIPYFGTRSLDRLVLPEDLKAAPAKSGTPSTGAATSSKGRNGTPAARQKGGNR